MERGVHRIKRRLPRAFREHQKSNHVLSCSSAGFSGDPSDPGDVWIAKGDCVNSTPSQLCQPFEPLLITKRKSKVESLCSFKITQHSQFCQPSTVDLARKQILMGNPIIPFHTYIKSRLQQILLLLKFGFLRIIFLIIHEISKSIIKLR